MKVPSHLLKTLGARCTFAWYNPGSIVLREMTCTAWNKKRKERIFFMATVHPVPQDNKAYRFPVSVKGIVYHNDKVVLLKNERDEWELPGGK